VNDDLFAYSKAGGACGWEGRSYTEESKTAMGAFLYTLLLSI